MTKYGQTPFTLFPTAAFSVITKLLVIAATVICRSGVGANAAAAHHSALLCRALTCHMWFVTRDKGTFQNTQWRKAKQMQPYARAVHCSVAM